MRVTASHPRSNLSIFILCPPYFSAAISCAMAESIAATARSTLHARSTISSHFFGDTEAPLEKAYRDQAHVSIHFLEKALTRRQKKGYAVLGGSAMDISSKIFVAARAFVSGVVSLAADITR